MAVQGMPFVSFVDGGVRYQWSPMEDITAWELSFVVAMFAGGQIRGFRKLPDAVKRHFEVIDDEALRRGIHGE